MAKILLSAYACEPNRGSEPGVGWHWAIEIAKRGHEVIVLTRKNNKDVISKESGIPDNVSFLYYDLPDKLMFLKKVFGVQVYYFLWQIGIYFFVKKRIKQLHIDFIHHITFVAIRKYSFLCFLGVPFYYGPLGGGENCPKVLLKDVSFKNKLKEFVRNQLNKLVRFNPLSNLIFKQSRKIFATTEQSLFYINQTFQHKTILKPAIGIQLLDKSNSITVQSAPEIKLLYVGQFLYWKGLQLCFDALKELADENINFKLTLVGKGSEQNSLKEKIKNLNLESQVEWINWLPQEQLAQVYAQNDLFLFPSLHDSGGMVVLEAMSEGLPVITLDIGGPGIFVNEKVGSKIPVLHRSYHQVVTDYAKAIKELAQNRTLLSEKATNAKNHVEEFSWTKTIDNAYSVIENDYQSIALK